MEQDSKFCTRCGNSTAKQGTVLVPATPHASIPNPIPVPTLDEMAAAAETVPSSSTHTIVPLPRFQNAWQRLRQAAAVQRRNIVIAACTVAIAAAGYTAFTFLAAKEKGTAPLIYMKDNALFFKTTALKQSLEVSDKLMEDADDGTDPYHRLYLYRYVETDRDKNRLFYLDNMDSEDGTGSLYVRDLRKKSNSDSDARGTKLASNVASFEITAKGDYVLYQKRIDDNEEKLYLHDLSEEIFIDRDVSSFYLSESGNQMMYLVSDDNDHTESLYTRDFRKDGTKTKIDSNVARIVKYTSDFGKIYYVKDDSDKEHNNQSLYVKEKDKDKSKLISNVESVESASVNGSFFFTRMDSEAVNLYDLVDDDRLSADQQMTEPTPPAEPYSSQFERQIPQTDYWTGDTYYETVVDYDAYNAALDQYRNLYDEYEQKYQEFEAKKRRDVLRGELKSASTDSAARSLYRYNGSKEQLITNAMDTASLASADHDIVIYNKIVKSPSAKVALSAISMASEVETAYRNQYQPDATLYISMNGGQEKKFTDDSKPVNHLMVNEDGNRLYLIEVDEEGKEAGGLLSYEIAATGLQNKKVIDQDVSDYSLYGNRLYYFKDAKEGSGELLAFADGASRKIASDVMMGSERFVDGDDSVLYFADYSAKDEAGSLYMYRKKESIKLADDVHDYVYMRPSQIYYLTEFSLKNRYGDLWEYKGANDKKMIDDHVKALYDDN